MTLSAKPTSYTVNTGHAMCPDHLYMLDEGTGTTAVDAVGTLDLTIDNSSMWNTDATYGDILRFDATSSQKAVSGAAFSASTGIAVVAIVKSASATNPTGVQYPVGVGSTSAGIYGGIRFNTTGYPQGVVDTGGTTNAGQIATDAYDANWHLVAMKCNDTTGTDGLVHCSLDGGSWSTSLWSGSGDNDVAQFNRIALGCNAQSTPTSFFDGDVLAVFVYTNDYSTWNDAWISSLYDDPWQFFASFTDITSVGDDTVYEGEATTISGHGFGSTQGASTVKLKSGSLSVTQTVSNWSDTELTLTIDSDLLPFGNITVEVTVGSSVTRNITHTTPPAYAWGTIDVPWTAGWYSLWDGASPAVVDGDQYQYEILSNQGAAVVVNADGTVVIDSASGVHEFDYRVFDLTDSTWSVWKLATLTSQQYTSLGRGYGIPVMRRRRR